MRAATPNKPLIMPRIKPAIVLLLVVLLLVVLPLAGPAAAEPPAPSTPGELAGLLERLRPDRPSEEVSAAERALRQLGPTALPALLERIAATRPTPTQPESAAAEYRRRLCRIRDELDAAAAVRQIQSPTRVSGEHRNRPSTEVLTDLAARLGWTLRDRRGLAADADPRVSVSFRETPALLAVSQTCSAAGCAWRIRGDELFLEPPADPAAPPEVAAADGVFLLRTVQMRTEHDFLSGRSRTIWGLELLWERPSAESAQPKVEPPAQPKSESASSSMSVRIVGLDSNATVLAARDATGASWPTAGEAGSNPRSFPLRPAAGSTAIWATTVAPPAGVTGLDRLELAVTVMLVPRSERCRLPVGDAAAADTVTAEQSGVPILLRPPQEVGSRWQTQVLIGLRESPAWAEALARGVLVGPHFEVCDRTGRFLTLNTYTQGPADAEQTHQLYVYRNGDPPTTLVVELPVSFQRHTLRFALRRLRW